MIAVSSEIDCVWRLKSCCAVDRSCLLAVSWAVRVAQEWQAGSAWTSMLRRLLFDRIVCRLQAVRAECLTDRHTYRDTAMIFYRVETHTHTHTLNKPGKHAGRDAGGAVVAGGKGWAVALLYNVRHTSCHVWFVDSNVRLGHVRE
jgi:hypothetical protein